MSFGRPPARWDTLLSHLAEKPELSVCNDLVSVDKNHRLTPLEANP